MWPGPSYACCWVLLAVRLERLAVRLLTILALGSPKVPLLVLPPRVR
jgi:hypothetical protein